MCEAAGIEVDYPLLDDGLVDFSLTLPGSLKLRRSDLRFAFKQAFSSYLPQQILEKEKHGFGLPFGEWLNTSDELRSKIMPCVERFRDRRILEDAFIDDMLHKHKHEHATYFGNMLWLIAVLENWLAARTS
jgi:asparagine synthase (glutamine-hydrolysing)